MTAKRKIMIGVFAAIAIYAAFSVNYLHVEIEDVGVGRSTLIEVGEKSGN